MPGVDREGTPKHMMGYADAESAVRAKVERLEARVRELEAALDNLRTRCRAYADTALAEGARRWASKFDACAGAVAAALKGGDAAAEAAATGPERDLADLERLARRYTTTEPSDLKVFTIDGELCYATGSWDDLDVISRAEALALLKGAK
jgi:hypothetical protein